MSCRRMRGSPVRQCGRRSSARCGHRAHEHDDDGREPGGFDDLGPRNTGAKRAGPRASATSSVPPPTAVSAARTTTPRRSSPVRPAASTINPSKEVAMFGRKKSLMPTPEQALPGRAERDAGAGAPLRERCRLAPPFPDGIELAMFGMGCFWGAERKFWQAAGRATRRRSATRPATRRTRPTRRCARGRTGHNEVVLVVFDPTQISLRRAAARVLGESRSDAGHAAGQRRRHAVPLGHLHVLAPSSAGGRGARATRTSSALHGGRLRRDHHRDPRRRRSSTTPRTTTSSTWPRTRGATAGSAAPGVCLPDRPRRGRAALSGALTPQP